jgi:hypothetical protein
MRCIHLIARQKFRQSSTYTVSAGEEKPPPLSFAIHLLERDAVSRSEKRGGQQSYLLARVDEIGGREWGYGNGPREAARIVLSLV